MNLTKLFTLIVALAFGTLTALAGTSLLIPWATVDGGVGSGAIYGLAIDGTNAYCQLSLGNGVQIVRINDVAGAQIRTQLVSPTTWTTASGETGCTSFHGFDLSGTDYVQFSDTISDAIWRVNKTTGLLICYCDKATITNATGRSAAGLGSIQCVNPANGEHVFYESTSKSLMTTTGSNACNVLVTYTEYTNALGTTANYNGGMNFDNSGNLYIGNSAAAPNGGLVKRDAGGNLSLLFDRVTITNLSLSTSLLFSTMKMGPDGKFYFRTGSGTMASILSFDPADPAGTLSRFVSFIELTNSVAASANVNCLRYYGTYPSASSGWAWHQFGQNGVYLTAIPEPVLFGLLGVAALFMRRAL